MQENFGIKVVAGFFIVVGTLSLFSGCFLLWMSVALPIIDWDNSGKAAQFNELMKALSVAIILFSILIFPVSAALHKLKHWAYIVSFGLLFVFSLIPIPAYFLFSFGLFFHSTALFYFVAILILNILVGATLYQNRSLFIDRQSL